MIYARISSVERLGHSDTSLSCIWIWNDAEETLDYKVARIAVVNGKEVWKSIVRTYMLNLDDLEIVSQFNAEIRGFYNYYSIANNSYVINSFYHIMSYSMYKVFMNKYNHLEENTLK